MAGLFHTPLVESHWDVFWEDCPATVKTLEQKDTLVISLPFAAGGPEEQQLHKMLAACKLAHTDYNVIQLEASSSVAWHKLREQCGATKVLLLGILPAQLGVSALFIPHAVNHFDEALWIPTISLTQLMDNAALKQQLWVNVFQPVYLELRG